MWGLPTLGIEPMSPVLAGGWFTTEPPGKLPNLIFSLLLDLLEAFDSVNYRLSTRSWKFLFPQFHSHHLPLDLPFPIYYVIKCSHQNLNLSIKFRILLCTSEKNRI